MPGSLTSSTYFPWPRRKRASSLRFMEWPMPPISGEVRGVVLLMIPPDSLRRLLRGVLNGLDNVDVTGTETEVPGNPPADVMLARRWVVLQKSVAGHHHARRTEAALQSVLLMKPFLDAIELAILLQSFDRHHVAPVGLDGERRARLDGLAVEQHRTGAAARGIAADVRAGHGEVFAEEVDQQQARLDLAFARGTVDVDGDLARGHI